MKNKITIYIAITVLALSAISCEKWLDVMPKTMQPSEEMFDTYQGYKDALTGCYLKMKHRNLWGEHMTITSVEYLAQHWQLWSENTVADAIKKHDYLDDNVRPVFQRIYSGLFNVIVQANSIIDAIPLTGKIAIEDPDSRGVVEGEAYAIRALCHFEVLRLFGQVPGGAISVRLPFTDDVSREPSKYYDYAEYIRLIEDDLKKAAELLFEHDPFVEYDVATVNNTGSDAGTVRDPFLHYRQLRLNYWAVKALQARFYLYTGKTAEAYAAANEVITAANDGKGFDLAGGNTAPMNNLEPTSSSASAAEKYYALPGEGLFMLSNHQLVDYISTIFRGDGTTWVNLYMSPERMEGSLFGETLASTNNNRFKLIWRRKPSMYADRPVFELLKYDQTDATSLSPMNLLLNKQVMPLLRLSEMYLIAMETSNDLTEINTLYDAYRTARNITGTTFADKREVLDMVGKEYRREFFGEGQMFGFYKRHNATSMVWSDKTMTEDDYIVPLPMTEFDPNL
jgi:hypothetical protein